MNYIINPMWFYWLGVVNVFNKIAGVVFIISGIGSVVAGIARIVFSGEFDDEEASIAMRFLKVALPLAIISALILVFVPSKNTLIEMQIARYATQENAELTIDAIKSAVDYVVQAIQGVGK